MLYGEIRNEIIKAIKTDELELEALRVRQRSLKTRIDRLQEEAISLSEKEKMLGDLKREVDTVKIALDKYPIIVDKRLRELNYGDFNGKPSNIVDPMKKEHIKEPYPNGESYEQAIARTHEFYKEIKEKHLNKMVLVVGHRATQYGLDTLAGGETIEECLNTPFKWQPYWEYNL